MAYIGSGCHDGNTENLHLLHLFICILISDYRNKKKCSMTDIAKLTGSYIFTSAYFIYKEMVC